MYFNVNCFDRGFFLKKAMVALAFFILEVQAGEKYYQMWWVSSETSKPSDTGVVSTDADSGIVKTKSLIGMIDDFRLDVAETRNFYTTIKIKNKKIIENTFLFEHYIHSDTRTVNDIKLKLINGTRIFINMPRLEFHHHWGLFIPIFTVVKYHENLDGTLLIEATADYPLFKASSYPPQVLIQLSADNSNISSIYAYSHSDSDMTALLFSSTPFEGTPQPQAHFSTVFTMISAIVLTQRLQNHQISQGACGYN